MAGYRMDIAGARFLDEGYEELKRKGFCADPCRECGNTYVEIASGLEIGGGMNSDGTAVICPKCGEMSGIFDLPWKAILDWNRKTAPAEEDEKKPEQTSKKEAEDYALSIRDYAIDHGVVVKGKLRRQKTDPDHPKYTRKYIDDARTEYVIGRNGVTITLANGEKIV